MRELKRRSAPISALGIQAHEPHKGRLWYSPEQLWRCYDELAALGYPIYITEFIPQSSGKPIVGPRPQDVWDEATLRLAGGTSRTFRIHLRRGGQNRWAFSAR